jgi:hypothetical protein
LYLIDDIFSAQDQQQAHQDQNQQAAGRTYVGLAAEGLRDQKPNNRFQTRQYPLPHPDKYYDVETFYLLIDKFYNSQVEIVEGTDQI